MIRFKWIALLLTTMASAQTIELETSVLEVDTVYTGLDIPWEIRWGADNMIWMTERYGVVSRLDPVTKSREIILDLTDEVYQQSESGLLGLALHPRFEEEPFVYLVYTYNDSGIKERLVRFEWDGQNLINPLTIIEGIEGNTTHIGSRLLFLEDETFLMTTGDAQDQPSSQNVEALTGKVLRFNADGSIPDDNPFQGSPIWSWGHRNAQGMVLVENKVFSSEHGPTTDDEINIIEKSANYGWPEVHGFCDTPNEIQLCAGTREPIWAWTPTIAPSDLIWYSHSAIPEFENSLLMAVLKEKELLRIRLNEQKDAVTEVTSFFKEEFNRLRDVLQGPDGELYLATSGNRWTNDAPNTHSIIRLRPLANPTENISKKKIKFGPNPFEHFIEVELEKDVDFDEVQLFDLQGRQLITESIHGKNALRLDFEGLESGIYLLQLRGDKDAHTVKLLKQ